MADKSSDDVLRPAWSLATSGVKIIAVGIGSPCHHNQLSSITFSSSNFLCMPTLDNVTSVTVILLVFIRRWCLLAVISISSTLVVCDWCISILIVLIRRCFLRGPLWYRLAVVLFDRGHPRFWHGMSIPLSLLMLLG